MEINVEGKTKEDVIRWIRKLYEDFSLFEIYN